MDYMVPTWACLKPKFQKYGLNVNIWWAYTYSRGSNMITKQSKTKNKNQKIRQNRTKQSKTKTKREEEMAETASSGEEASASASAPVSVSDSSEEQQKMEALSSSSSSSTSIASMAEDLQRTVIESTRSLQHNSSTHLRTLQVTSLFTHILLSQFTLSKPNNLKKQIWVTNGVTGLCTTCFISVQKLWRCFHLQN